MKYWYLYIALALSAFAGNAQITAYRYWFDNDFNNAVIVNGSFGNNYYLQQSFPVSQLSNGLHTFNIAFRDGSYWSSTNSSFFYKTQAIGNSAAKYQYWIDNNVQDSVTVSIANTNNLNLITDLPLQNVSNGLHTLNIRFKPDGGDWSLVKSDFFFKAPIIANNKIRFYRYWFDNEWQHFKTFSTSTDNADNFITKIDVEGLSNGIHTLKYKFRDKAGLWSSIVTDTFTKIPITNKNIVYPKLYLNKAVITNTGALSVSGKDFTANGLLQLVISEVSNRKIYLDTQLYADAEGKFSYTFTANAAMAKGTYKVVSQDAQKGVLAPEKYFSIGTTNITASNDIVVKTPIKATSYCTGQNIEIGWYDKMKRNVNLSFYPLCNSNAERKCSYEISVIDTLTNLIEQQLTVIFCRNIYETINQTKVLTLNRKGAFRIKVKDVYSNEFGMSDWFKVTDAPVHSITELVWDKSCPPIMSSPLGVCADGTSRILFRISKKVPFIADVQSTIISLSSPDAVGGGIDVLGKLKVSTVKNNYSLEGNDANQLTINTSAVADDGSIWVWYVAPDNFYFTLRDKFADERTVNAHIITTMANGIRDTSTVPLKIVRPPLFLAHGLGGNEKTWDNFQCTNKAGIAEPFDNQNIFKVINKANLCGNCSYDVNANMLVNMNSGNFGNSLEFTIRLMHQKGIACSKVDYVCHSMGGDIIRYAITEQPYKNYYYAVHPNQAYKNYNKGFVNKLITLNTPHWGSPQANLIDDVTRYINGNYLLRYSGYIGDLIYLYEDGLTGTKSISNSIGTFIRKDNSTIPPLYYPSDAVKNLRVPQTNGQGGIALKETSVKHHFIIGDIDAENTNLVCEIISKIEDISLPKFVKTAKTILKKFRQNQSMVMYLTANLGKPANEVIDFAFNLLDENNYSIVCILLSWYYGIYGYSDMIIESDIVVPVTSQTAGLSKNLSNVSLFSGFTANHLSIHDRVDVGNKVLELLNTDIADSKFGNIIPATVPYYSGSQPNSPLNLMSEKPVLYIYDTTKVKIDYPSTNILLNYDSSLAVKYRLKDTVNFHTTEIIMKDDNYTSISKAPSQNVQLQTNRLRNGVHLFYLTAFFEYPDTIKIFYDSSYYTQVFPDSVREIVVTPDAKRININQEYQPNIKLLYDSTLINLDNNDSLIIVSIGDTSVISYSQAANQFLGKANGKTWCAINYKGKSDTIYYYVGDIDAQATNCPSSIIKFGSGTIVSGSTYKWQIDSTGNGFENLDDNSIFNGSSTDTLTLNNPPTSLYGTRFRCLVSSANGNTFSQEYTLKFSLTWNGSVSSAWENPANWNCNAVPDENVDVIINAGVPNYPQVNSLNASCRSLTTKPSSTVNIAAGMKLKITGF